MLKLIKWLLILGVIAWLMITLYDFHKAAEGFNEQREATYDLYYK